MFSTALSPCYRTVVQLVPYRRPQGEFEDPKVTK